MGGGCGSACPWFDDPAEAVRAATESPPEDCADRWSSHVCTWTSADHERRRAALEGARSRGGAAEIEELIRSTGFFRNKTKNILGAAQVLVEEFGGVVPQTMDELLRLPGVARKTANVLLGSAFGKNEGFVVDTHIGRLSNRLGLSKEEDQVKVERDLMKQVPRDAWTKLGHQLIWHGRRVCKSQKPACHECTLAPLCPSFGRL